VQAALLAQSPLQETLLGRKPGGKVISISGPPDPVFAERIGAPWFVKVIMRLLSASIRKKAKQLNVTFSFLFMQAHGDQLSRITALIEGGSIKPVLDKVFPFEQTNEAMEYVEKGRAKGKVVVKLK